MKKTGSRIIAVIVFLAFALVAFGSSEDEKTSVESGNAKTSKTTAAQEKETVVRIGETLNDKGLKITFDSAEKWTSDNMFIKPGEGKEFIRAHFTVVNDTDSDKMVSTFDFDCYVNDEHYDNSYYGDDQLSATISSGRKTSGYVYFEVPENASRIEIEYETNLWTDKKAVFLIESLN